MDRSWHDKLAWAGIALGVFLVVGQATITFPARMAEGGGPLRALVFFLSFLTIWTNIGLVVVYFAVVSGRRSLRALAGPTARTLMAGSIFIVMTVYALLLAPIWDPQGLQWVVDVGLHYIAPILYLVWWALGPHPVRLRWARAGVMMLYPLSYCVWIVLRGVAIGRWPYPFVDVAQLGWGTVLVNMVGLALAFGVVYLGMIALSRFLHGATRHSRALR